MKQNACSFACLLSIVFLSSSIRAATIAEYNGAASASGIAAATPVSVFNATTTDANLSATPLIANAPAKTSGSFIIISGNPTGTETNIQKFDAAGPNSFGAENMSYFEFTPNNGVQAGNIFKSTDEITAKNVGAYLSLTITPLAGYEMDISSVMFRVAQLTSVNTAARGFALATSRDSLNYSMDLALDGQITGFRDVTGGWETFSIDTSDMAAYQHITDTVEFRFYGWTPAGGNGIGFDKFTIDGAVQPIPEPTTTGILATGFALLVLARYCGTLKNHKAR